MIESKKRIINKMKIMFSATCLLLVGMILYTFASWNYQIEEASKMIPKGVHGTISYTLRGHVVYTKDIRGKR